MKKEQTLLGRPVIEVDDMPNDEIVLGHFTGRVRLKIRALPLAEPGEPITFIARVDDEQT